ncbi:MAG: 50S ribosomal protein L18e [Nanoarchaeota archaeon]
MNNKHYQAKARISALRKAATADGAAVWKRLADELSRSTRAMRAVNVAHLAKHADKDRTLVVPGKVLGTGVMTAPVTVCAFSFSDAAQEKIKAAKGKTMTVEELLKKNPEGKNIKIIG